VQKVERGAKRRCLSCNIAFFDLNRSPIVSPKCAETFQVVRPSQRRGEGFPTGDGWRLLPRHRWTDEVSESDACADGDIAHARSGSESPDVDLI